MRSACDALALRCIDSSEDRAHLGAMLDTAQADASESALVARLQAGDDRAYEELVRAYGGRLLGVARRILHREEDARDAVQDAFVSAFRAVGSFDGGSRLVTWLHRITVNASLMKLRRARRRPEVALEELLPVFDADGGHALPVQDWEHGERAVLRGETRSQVRACIERLPIGYRSVLVLRDVEELSTEETARALGLAEGAVKTRLHRARQALRALLQPIVQPAAEPRRVRRIA
jgi:RNA polymerase sigma-70 factor (ECF subfamily)